MRRAFPVWRVVTASPPSRLRSLNIPKLKVHAVGCYEASFVPTLKDFERLDERFRIPAEVWADLPEYRDYGFAVFQLKETSSHGVSRLVRGSRAQKLRHRRVHPVAFRFPCRTSDLLFLPTVHVHDGELHASAKFDHMLDCQPDPDMTEYLEGWEKPSTPASEFIKVKRTQGMVDSSRHCWRCRLEGRLENKDTLVGKGGMIPELQGV